jgi:cell division protease FtsH
MNNDKSLPDGSQDLLDALETSDQESVRDVLTRKFPSRLLVGHALERCLDAATLARIGDALILIQIPDETWVPSMKAVVRTRAPAEIFSVTGDRKHHDLPSLDGLDHAIVVLTDRLDRLPESLRAAADYAVAVSGLTHSDVRGAIKEWCGRAPRAPFADVDVAALPLATVTAAFRRGSKPRQIVSRLRRAASRAQSGVPTGTPLLHDLHGYGAAGDWAREAVDAFGRVKNGSEERLSSALLGGPPGTGKTTLARSLALTAGVKFVETSVSDWFASGTGHLDAVVKAAKAFFNQLRSTGPVVGLIDELDALPSRATLRGDHVDYWVVVITGVLREIDALRRDNPHAVLIGTTNHAERLDPALIRPGRFDRAFYVTPPDEAALAMILRMHLGDDLADQDLTLIARMGAGATGAIAAGWIHGARERARAEGRSVTVQDVVQQVAPRQAGRDRSKTRDVAVHEAGHVVVARAVGLTVHSVSVIEAGASGGTTTVEALSGAPSRRQLEHHVMCALGGRAADEVCGTGATAGARSDLVAATRLITGLNAMLGLGKHLTVCEDDREARLLAQANPALRDLVETELQELYEQATQIVKVRARQVLMIADALTEKLVLSSAEIDTLLREGEPEQRRKPRAGPMPRGLVTRPECVRRRTLL